MTGRLSLFVVLCFGGNVHKLDLPIMVIYIGDIPVPKYESRSWHGI